MLELPQHPVRDFAAQSNSIELWVKLNRWTGTHWLFDSDWHYMYWDPTYRQFNINWPLGTFLHSELDLGGWRYYNGAPVGAEYGIGINPGYTVQISVVVRWKDWNGYTRVAHQWPSAGTAYCAF